VPGSAAIAYKAYEIEELVDIYVFRRLGIGVARLARMLGMTPNGVSIVSGLVGATGGALLVSDELVWPGVALIFAHGVFDSADGQLARLTGRTSEWGRMLDGLSGYATHIAAYLAIVIRVIGGGGSWWFLALALAAGLATMVHAQLYDYFRTAYAAIVLKGRPSAPSAASTLSRSSRGVLAFYERTQRRLSGRHLEVESVVAAHASNGVVAEADRRRYRACFRPLVPGWNLFGDNVRRYGFAVLAWLHHLEWYFVFILVPLNVLLVVMSVWQRRADARFLNSGPDGNA
jgi:phosphatidylglycerophosphate synthase